MRNAYTIFIQRIYQILAEIIQAGGDTLLSEIHKLINYVLN